MTSDADPEFSRQPLSDEASDLSAADGTRINVEQRWEVTYWCEELRCTERQLREVVMRVGPRVVDVRRALGRR